MVENLEKVKHVPSLLTYFLIQSDFLMKGMATSRVEWMVV